MTDLANCPACNNSTDMQKLETIDLKEQHTHFAPADLAYQQLLTVEAKKSAPEYTILLCNRCGLEFAHPFKAPNQKWYELAYQVQDLYPNLRWEFQCVLQFIKPNEQVFEFGCGTGGFLELCREHGIQAAGVDFSSQAIEQCQTKGLNVLQVKIGQPYCVPAGVRPEHVVAFQVIEHLDEPAKLLEIAREVTTTGARLWVAVPSHRRWNRLFRQRDFLDQPPHHLSRWTPDAFRNLGQQTGWIMNRIHYEPFTMRVALWKIATEMKCYKVASNWGWLRIRSIERLLRLFIFPLALARWLSLDRNLTGFSMLAEFSKSEGA